MEFRYSFVFWTICSENTFSFFRQKSINTAVVTEQTTEAFDWKLIGFIQRGRIHRNFSHSISTVCSSGAICLIPPSPKQRRGNSLNYATGHEHNKWACRLIFFQTYNPQIDHSCMVSSTVTNIYNALALNKSYVRLSRNYEYYKRWSFELVH